SPGREQNDIARDRIAVLEMDAEGAVIHLFDLVQLRVEAELDALPHGNLHQPVADAFVIAAQQRRGAVYQRHLTAELVEDARELIGDIAAADYGETPGARLQMEHFVGGDTMLRPFD